MTASLRVLAAIIAVAMLIISVAVFLTGPREISMLWFYFGGVACAFAVEAVGYFVADRRTNFHRYSLYAVFAFALSMVAAFAISLGDEFSGNDSWQVVACIFVGLMALVATAGLLGVLTRRATVSVTGVQFASVALVVGALFVLSSLFFKIGLNKETTGWTVLIRQDHWVTHYASIGQGPFLGSRIAWLQPIFGPVGYAFYLLALATSLAAVIWVLKRRFRAANEAESDFLARLTTLAALSSIWLLSDIFWGWHYDLSEKPWLATIAAVCWMATLIFGAVLLVPVAHGKREAWRFRALLVFQLPLLTFNAVMLPIYMGRDDYLPGLGLAFLMIGLQVQCWTCVYLMTTRKKQEVKVMKPFAAAA